ncbi:uncharacterized protein [Venturia canescens]|uniref:uncharacterized protein n=1 Tax=Venturia canescens TaxID=32260 RepID=UPI001C9D16E6|nr:uncharacterized protein LOC122417274 [Venturia canescens]XP_043286595.1 uncharacterized protein LOC122417274 [Venturia canescens]
MCRQFSPLCTKKREKSQLDLARHERLLKRKERMSTSTAAKPQEKENIASDIEMGLNETPTEAGSTCIACQTDACDNEGASAEGNTFWSWNNDKNEASTQTNIYIGKPNKNERIIVKELKTVADKSCGPDDIFHYGFSGFSDIGSNKTMLQLGGVSLIFFNVLLNLITVKTDGQPAYYRVLNKQNRLLLFLMKMKLGISFSGLACFFKIHESTASQIFFEILTTLTEKTKTWIFWPSRESIKKNLPIGFKKYPNCRCIIDCTEIFTETPPTVEQRVLMYSNYKSRFTVKYLIAITPDGFVCKLSKGYGGRATDSFITNDCGLLSCIEPGDTVLADKGFPQIKSELLKRNALLVIPPFAFDPQFTNSEIDETYKIASVRIHVERAIQRIKLCNILKLIPISLLPYLDAIMHMCCVIANSKPPLIKNPEAANSATQMSA